MRSRPIVAALAAVALLAAGCSDDDAATPPDSTTSTSSSTTTTSTTTTTTTTTMTTTTTTEAPRPDCPTDDVLATVDAAIGSARMTPGDGWSTDTTGNPFAERTTTGDEYAARLGLDCGLTASHSAPDGERLAIAAWTGPRMAYLVQSTDGPSTPYRRDATVTVSIDATEGEFLDGETRGLWAGTFDSDETFVVGHVDYSLGPAAKDWVAAERPPFDDGVTLDAERHAIAALEEAEMRLIGIAEPPQSGSEEGYVQFTSPAGQILVVDVAPTDWFDPMLHRYYTGPSAVETIGGMDVRITEPMEDDNLGFIRGVEFGWACDEFVWILQPPFNGDGDEMRISVEAIVETEECTAG